MSEVLAVLLSVLLAGYDDMLPPWKKYNCAASEDEP
jgi:hypothetical protein